MMVILQKKILKKLLFTTFLLILAAFPASVLQLLHLILKLSTVFPAYCLPHVLQLSKKTFAATVKIMIDFICRFTEKASKVTCILVYT